MGAMEPVATATAGATPVADPLLLTALQLVALLVQVAQVVVLLVVLVAVLAVVRSLDKRPKR
jgi:hypothetical protein